FTSSRQGDSPLLPDLLSQIPEGEEIATVTADGAYDTRRCHAAVARNEILRATRHLGRALWKKWAGYHVRSRVEAQMNRLKLF
ncbi:IS5/IS1182 family transposase, partial [Rhodovulum sulfidophilum]|uniref:transposase n=1 Tax=Rhodovulum sulfidophilum TaxID=35806 RepID=UPI001A5C6350|nr:IS5/IS1182 family transposase [Rhodovulum sulfidophilum]